MNDSRLSPISALVAHLEGAIEKSRVLLVGDASRSTAEHLLDRGARLVQVLDPDARRVALAAAHNTERRISYAPLSDGALRDGSYDCTIVENAEIREDFSTLAAGVARSISSRGIAVFCTQNDEVSTGLLGAKRANLRFEQFSETLEQAFEQHLLLGQAPFLGYSVVSLDLDQPPEPILDNAYLGGEADDPDFYIALCGSAETLAELSLEDMSIVQLSAARFVTDNESAHQEALKRASRRAEELENDLASERRNREASETERLVGELEERDAWILQLESRSQSADARADDAQAQADELQQQLEDALSALSDARDDADRAVAARDAAQSDLKQQVEANKNQPEARGASLDEWEDLKEELSDTTTLLGLRDKEISALKQKSAALEKELQIAARGAEEGKHHSAGREALESELNSLDATKDQLESALKAKDEALSKMKRRLSEQEKEIDELHAQLDETEDALSAAKGKSKPSGGVQVSELEKDVRGLEEQLRDRGRRIVDLESQLRKLESYAKTLKVELEQTPGAATDDDDRDELTSALAEREADLIAAKWKIEQLQQNGSRQ